MADLTPEALHQSCHKYRRVLVLDDSSGVDHLQSYGSEKRPNSFLSDDHSEDVSVVSQGNKLHERESSDNDSYSSSFVVSDDEYFTDDSSYSPSSPSESSNEVKHNLTEEQIRRVQGLRFAKKNSSEIAFVQPCEQNSFYSDSCAATLDNITKGGRSEMQPSFSKEAHDGSAESENSLKSSCESDDNDDSFEKYLKKLRTQTTEPISITKLKRNGAEEKSFIVSDSDVSGSCSESESETTDSSWSPSSNECDDQSRRSDPQLLKSIKESFASPSVLSHGRKKPADEDEHFLISLSHDYSELRHPEAELYVKKGIKNAKLRTQLTSRLFEIFRRQCFNEELPEFLSVTWNPRLCKTAGMCRNKSDRTSCIELSPKVCSTPDRVRDTLVHEMCHAAVWVVDGRIKEGHGAVWKKWAYMCMKRFSFLPVIGRCHDYEIDAKFIYECEGCGQQVRRHTKSFDTTRKICGICKARFVLQVRPNAKNKAPNNELQHNSFAKYVKENYGKYKKPGMKHGEVMRTLAQLYKEQSMQRISEEETKLQDKSTRKINKEEAEVQDLLDLSVLSIHN